MIRYESKRFSRSLGFLNSQRSSKRKKNGFIFEHLKLTKAKEKKRKAKDDVKRKREGNEQYNLRENAPANKLLRRESSQNSFKLRERKRKEERGLWIGMLT